MMGLIKRIRDFWYKIEDYDRLKGDYEELRQRADEITEAAKNTLAECQKLLDGSRMTRKEILEIARTREGYTHSFDEWKKAENGKCSSLETEVGKLRRDNRDLRIENAYLSIENVVHIGNRFSDDMKLLLAENPTYGTIPFFYQGVGKSSPVYTPAFLELFSSIIGVSEGLLKNLSLNGLLDYVEEDKRKELERAFFHGDRLKDYSFRTTGVSPRDLVIGRSYPVFHKLFKKGRVPIGIGLFFIDPQNVATDPTKKSEELYKILGFSRELLHSVRKTAKELSISNKGIREIEYPRPLEEIPARELY